MQSKITLINIGSAFKRGFLLLSLLTILVSTLNAQTTITATSTFTSGNGLVTFNFTNNNANPVIITGIGSIVNLTSGNVDVSAYFKPSAISGAPGAISAANGWNSFGSTTITANGLGTIQPFLTCASLLIPAGATYGIAVNSFVAGTTTGALGYNNAVGVFTFTGGGAVVTTGTNVGFAGAGVPAAPTTTPRNFIGTVTFINATTCSGAPVPGNTVSSVTSACSGININLSLQNCLTASGLIYQWQSSPTGAAGTYTNIAGATAITLTTTQTASTYYQAIVTCSGSSTTSTPILVALTPQSNCYCAAGSTQTTFEKIANVKFGTLNNSSTSLAGYENFTNLTSTASFEAGSINPITITGNADVYSEDQVIVWIDYNHNGSFSDAGETVFTSAMNAGPYTGNITIPTTALLGNTRMRIRMLDVSFGNGNNTPCGNNTWGQVEDYTINITACIPVTVTTANQPINATIQCGSNASFTFGATGTGITYQWQQRNNATSPWNNLTNAGVYSGVNTKTLVVTNALVNLNGNQYRVIYTGGCSGTDFSNVVTLTVTQLVATVNPASLNICSGTLNQLSITNTAPPATTQFCSGTINLQIPDVIGPPASSAAVANAGINHSIPVTIPGGAIITSMNVRLNIAHSYVGDLVIVLKAPNGNILNLDYHKSGTGTGGANFTNTVISSAGTAAISSGTPPYTGTFRADASIGAGSFGDPSGSGPTAFQPNVTTWAALYSIPNGSWTIAIQDPSTWGGDIGTLNNWCIELTYGVPSTGVFTGPAGTIFTDPAGTIPYTGTPVSTVYVNPTVTTNYSVVVSNPLCTSAPLTIPITVNNPIVGTSTTSSTSVCVGGNASFTASAPTSGGIILHQWKLSTDNGVTFTNVVNGGVYSGATTSTLTITGATINMDNYKYKDSLYVTACSSFVNTNVATLTVNPNPVISVTGPITALNPGMTTTLSAAVSPNPGQTYQWYRNGILIPGATSSTLVVDIDGLGEYTVSVSDVKGCTGTSNAFTITAGTSSDLFIYANPNTGQFQVRFNSGAGNTNLTRMLNIYDAKGSRIYSRAYPVTVPFERLDVDLRNHGKGVYIVELADRNGRRIKAQRILIL